MKTKKLTSLKLNKASISNLQRINGGADDAANNAAQEPVGFLSIGRKCSLKNSCRRVCGPSSATITPID